MSFQFVTPAEAARRKAALQANEGNLTSAATELGISRSGLKSWLRSRSARGEYIKPANTARAEELAEVAHETVEERLEVMKLQAENATLAEQLKLARNVQVSEPITVSRKTRDTKDDFVRVVIPDSHGAHISRSAAAAFLKDLKSLDPDEIVMLGDHLDCGGFLAQHHSMGFVAETTDSYADDVRATNDFLNQIQEAAPKANIHYLAGNHENRVERWCVTETLRNQKDAEFLLSVFGPEAVLGLKERGIQYYRSSERYHGLPVPGTIKLGECTYTHGISCGTHATYDHVKKFGISVVHGHTHRAQAATVRTVGGGVIGGWSPGCLAQLQPLYMATNITDWSHGFAIQIVSRSGKFLHLNIPIIDGESLLNGIHYS